MTKKLTDEKILKSYFTGREDIYRYFETAIKEKELSKPLIVLYGLSGIGKSALLKILRLKASESKLPVGFVSAETAKAPENVLDLWAQDLKESNVNFPNFNKTLTQYRLVINKLDEQMRKQRVSTMQTISKAGQFGVEAAANLASSGISSVVSAGFGAGANFLADMFNRPDVDLIQNPIRELTKAFLKDLKKIAIKKRLVLIIDGLDELDELEDWLASFIRDLPTSVLIIIAGQKLPQWGEAWPEWRPQAEVHEIKPLDNANSQKLVERYYKSLGESEVDDNLKREISKFALGMPLAIISAVQLAKQYGLKNLQEIKPQMLSELMTSLLDDLPNELLPPLEVAACLRWFNQDNLLTVWGETQAVKLYEQVKQLSFIRPHKNGFVVHSVVRELLLNRLRSERPTYYQSLHQKAANYFEQNFTGLEPEQRQREWLYHKIQAEEQSGILLFQQIAEGLTQYHLTGRLFALVNDVKNYPLHQYTSLLWLHYYNAQLNQLLQHRRQAEQTYEQISKDVNAEARLKAYALSSWAVLNSGMDYLAQDGALVKFVQNIEFSNSLMEADDPHLIQNNISLGNAYKALNQADKALDYFKLAIEQCKKQGNQYAATIVYTEVIGLYAKLGDWKNMQAARTRGLELLPKEADISITHCRLLENWGFLWVLTGNYLEAEKAFRDSLNFRQKLQSVDLFPACRELGFCLGMQGRYIEAEEFFSVGFNNYQNLFNRADPTNFAYHAVILLKQGKKAAAKKLLEKSIAIIEEWRDERSFPQVFYWTGILYELYGAYLDARVFLTRCLDKNININHYFRCGALIGLARIAYREGKFLEFQIHVEEAHQLAEYYQYYDHLAILNIFLAQAAWEGKSPLIEQSFATALSFHQTALQSASYYNQHLVNAILLGGQSYYAVKAIIPYCSTKGKEGQRMLNELRSWASKFSVPNGIRLFEDEN